MTPKKRKDEEAPSDYVPREKMVKIAPTPSFWDADFPSDGETPVTASGHVSRRRMTGMMEGRIRHAPVPTETIRSAVQAPEQGGNNLQRRIAAMGPPIRSNQDRAVTPPSGQERANGPCAQTPETPYPVERRPNYQVNSNRAGRGRGGPTMGMDRQAFQLRQGRHPSSDMLMPPPPSSMQRSSVLRRGDAQHVGAAEEEDGSAHRNSDVVPAGLEEAEEEEDGNAHRNHDVVPVELSGEESQSPGVRPSSRVGRPSSQEENLPPQPTSPLPVVVQGIDEARPQESLVVGLDSETVEVLEKRLAQVLGQVKDLRAEASADLRVMFRKGVQLANTDLSGIDPAILGEVWEDLEAEDAVGMVETDDPDIAALFDEEEEPKE
ncbi:hypothetical protein J4E93_001399 [Alternaria ventricosa]|uniref:uncharacterized protein n=1 Tax=Alternaria ventricosa TaxID=1187951 RepID=UPI0020C20BDB|nr:uncharacterized protein J4E93_001399 [Alternaria ventricosa]KAI4653632.1 hypothetical protein J4E93_001399 [Alternaria ventricosa]